MKKMFLCVITIVFFLFSPLSATADSWRVFDNAEILTQEERESLEDSILVFQKETNMDFVFLSTDDFIFQDGHQFDYACYFWDDGPYGFGKDASGMLYYLDMRNRIPTIFTSGNAVSALSVNDINLLHTETRESLVNGEYFMAISKILQDTKRKIVSYSEKEANR